MGGSMRWWQCGFIGAVTLCVVIAIKALIVVPIAFFRGTFQTVDARATVGFVASIVAIGFACGVVGWLGRGLRRKIGILGDMLTGLAVGLVFALGVVVVHDSEDRVALLWLFAVLGACLAPSIARDVNKGLGGESDHTNRHAD